MQDTLFKLRSLKTPLRYYGSKTRAITQLIPYFPKDLKAIVSPFLGGAGLELHLTSKNIKIYGYDKFYPLVNFWQQLQKKPNTVLKNIINYCCNYSPEQLTKMLKGDYYNVKCKLSQAALFLVLYNLSYNNSGLRGYGLTKYKILNKIPTRDYADTRTNALIHYKRVYNFYNDLLNVECEPFEVSLQKHKDLFAYCDPPYPTNYVGLYGNDKSFHEEFPHEKLAKILHSRQNWLLSYNDNEIIYELYPKNKFHYEYPKWHQTTRLNYACKSNEVLIMPEKYF